jgi:hypothetical protein
MLAKGKAASMTSTLILSPLNARLAREFVALALLAGLRLLPALGAETPTAAIKVDQVGYPVDGPKLALVSSPAKTFALKRSSDDRIVFKGELESAQPDPDTGDQIQAADFSRYRKPGTYYIDVPGVGRSWNFTLAIDPYLRTFYLAMRGFYGQRCGTSVDLGPEFAGFSHPACHLRRARQCRRLARCRRLRPLCGQLRHLDRDAVMGVGDLRTQAPQHTAPDS